MKITVLTIFSSKLDPNFATKYLDREFKVTLFCFQMIKKINFYVFKLFDFELAELK